MNWPFTDNYCASCNGIKCIVFTLFVAIALFIINNILLGAIVPSLPGGSATGISSMLAVTYVGLALKQMGYIPLIYFCYGLLGLISHILVGDWWYLLAIVFMVLCALVYDWLLFAGNYLLKTHLWAFPVFLAINQLSIAGYGYIQNTNNFSFILNIEYLAYALILGYLGIFMAFGSYKYTKHKLIFLYH